MLWTLSSLPAIAAVIVGIVVLRFWAGPFSIAGFPEQIALSLEQAFGKGWDVGIGSASISWGEGGPAVSLANVALRDPQGKKVLSAPVAAVEMDGLSLATGQVRPRAIVFRDLDLRIPASPAPAVGAQASAQVPDNTFAAAGMAAASAVASALGGREGALSSLRRAELRDARLILVDGRGGERVAFEDVTMVFNQTSDSHLSVTLSASGRTTPWQVNVEVEGQTGGPRRIDLAFSGLSAADWWMLSGQAGTPFKPGGTLEGAASGRIDGAGALLALDARVMTAGEGVRFTNPDLAPIKIDELSASLSRPDGATPFEVGRVRYAAGTSRVELAGLLTPPAGDEPWRLSLNGRDNILSGVLARDRPVPLDEIVVDASAPQSLASLAAHLGLATAQGKADAALQMEFGAAGPSARLTVKGGEMDLRSALRIWPSYAGSDVRDYLSTSLEGGWLRALQLDLDLPPEQFRIIGSDDRWVDEAMRISFTLDKAAFRPQPDMPLVSDASIEGQITARTANLKVPRGKVVGRDGLGLDLSEGVFAVPTTLPERPPAHITMRLSGAADGFVSLLSSDGLKPSLGIDLDPAGVAGAADLRVTLDMDLSPHLKPSDVRVAAQGALSRFSVERAFGNERLENGQLSLLYGQDQLQVKGDARLLGLPASIDIRQAGRGAPGEAMVNLVLDETTRRKRAAALTGKVSGPIPIKIVSPLAKNSKTKPRVEIDLAKAGIDNLVPGWAKPAGRPARLSFALVDRAGGGAGVEDLVLESQGLNIRGSAELKADSSLASMDLDSVKLSPGDTMRVKVDATGSITKVAVTGSVIDARPFLKEVASSGPPSSSRRKGEADRMDIDVDVTTPILTGHNDEAITAAQLKFSQRGKEVTRLAFSGRIGSTPVKIDLLRQPQQPSFVVLQTQDGGGLLRFADVYRRMVGGDLLLRLAAFEPRQTGDFTVRNFGVRDEPALGRIMSEQPTGSTSDRAPALAKSGDVAFTKMKVDFARTASRLDIKEAVVWGPQIGISIDGHIDYGGDRADLNGTFVPAYALNNMFSQVPVLGRILGGGVNEGLFAVSFRVQGPASAPTLSVNPLSAVAPGIFRKLVDAFRSDPNARGPSASTGSQ